MHVEVVYALPEVQSLITLEVEPPITARQAVERSGLLQRHPEIDLDQAKLGVFGKVVPPDRELAEGERVEIYRPLIADPRDRRRQRAAEGRTMGSGKRNS